MEKIARRLRQTDVEGRTVTLKLRYASFQTITRSHTMPTATALEKPLYDTVKGLLQKCSLTPRDAIRLIGVSVGSLVPAGTGPLQAEAATQQLSLFDEAPAPKALPNDPRQQELTKAVDRLKDKFGEGILTRARLVKRDEREPE